MIYDKLGDCDVNFDIVYSPQQIGDFLKGCPMHYSAIIIGDLQMKTPLKEHCRQMGDMVSETGRKGFADVFVVYDSGRVINSNEYPKNVDVTFFNRDENTMGAIGHSIDIVIEKYQKLWNMPE